MNLIRSVLVCGAAVLVTAVWMAIGYRLALDAIDHHRRAESVMGLLMVFPSSLVILGLAVGALHFWLPGERERGRQYRNRSRSSGVARLVKRQEQMIKRLRFLRQHPSAVLAFISVALVVSAAMGFAPPTDRERDQSVALHFLGIILGLAYLIILFVFLGAWTTNRWESYVDSSIRLTEERFARLNARRAVSQAGVSSTPRSE